MYCPNCGRENSENQNFCTGCGLKLPTVPQVVGKEQPAQLAPVYFQPEPKIWQNPLLYGLFMILIGMFLLILGKNAFNDKSISDMGTVITLLGTILLALKGTFLVLQQAGVLQLPKHEIKQQQLPQQHHFAIHSGEPQSVIEHTTRHLDATPVYEKPRNTQPTLK
jgi:hypothetical protein